MGMDVKIQGGPLIMIFFMIQFQEIYESDNHSFQDVLDFKNLLIHTPVWIKNGIAH